MHLCCQHEIGNGVKVVLRETDRQTDRQRITVSVLLLSTGPCSQTNSLLLQVFVFPIYMQPIQQIMCLHIVNKISTPV